VSEQQPMALSAATSAFWNRPDDLYWEAFHYFQILFGSSQADAHEMREIQLISYLPESVYRDRTTQGAVITGAIVAMYAHEVKADFQADVVDLNAVALAGARTIEEIMVCLTTMPQEVLHRLDEIILRQGVLTGDGLYASDLVFKRVLYWQHHDLRKHQRWLRALGKHARIQQGLEPTPLGDPFLREVKARMLEQLRPVVARWHEWHGRQTVLPTEEEIADAFFSEADRPDVPCVHEVHNRGLWWGFIREDALALVKLSVENLIHEFMGRVTQHDSDYVRWMISRR